VSALTILGYHNLEPTPFFRGRTNAGMVGFLAQLRFIRRFMHPVGLSEAAETLATGGVLPPRSIAVTFDDGYRDMCHVAAPLLKEFQIPASFFVVPAYLEGSEDPWWERLAWACEHSTADRVTWGDQSHPISGSVDRKLERRFLDDLKTMNLEQRSGALAQLIEQLAPTPRTWTDSLMLDWEHLLVIARLGFEIGSHSTGHAILARETVDAQRRDMECSRRVIEEKIDSAVRSIAYPNGGAGDFSSETMSAACEAGFLNGVTCLPGRSTSKTPRLALRRVLVSPTGGLAALSKALLRAHSPQLVRPVVERQHA
jgi:peptidoglycan/xylan/chitin deacetylase (PgdA/CDA1 family)